MTLDVGRGDDTMLMYSAETFNSYKEAKEFELLMILTYAAYVNFTVVFDVFVHPSKQYILNEHN